MELLFYFDNIVINKNYIQEIMKDLVRMGGKDRLKSGLNFKSTFNLSKER